MFPSLAMMSPLEFYLSGGICGICSGVWQFPLSVWYIFTLLRPSGPRRQIMPDFSALRLQLHIFLLQGVVMTIGTFNMLTLDRSFVLRSQLSLFISLVVYGSLYFLPAYVIGCIRAGSWRPWRRWWTVMLSILLLIDLPLLIWWMRRIFLGS